jgi:hypothetical protein
MDKANGTLPSTTDSRIEVVEQCMQHHARMDNSQRGGSVVIDTKTFLALRKKGEKGEYIAKRRVRRLEHQIPCQE